MTRIIAAALLALALTAGTALAGSVPDTAGAMASDIDAQLVKRLQLLEGPASGHTLIVTTPVSLDDFDASSPIARLMAEEMATWFVSSGYRVQEIRRGRDILFSPGKGELILSRDTKLLDGKFMNSALILTGTYVVTSRHVRFNIRLLSAPTKEVLAMTSRSLPMSSEVMELTNPETMARLGRIRPSVDTTMY